MSDALHISVIIPAYNEEKLLGQCLKSVLGQATPHPEFEVIVVDNASSDRTAEIAKAFGAHVVFEKTKGLVHARNAGFNVARGEIMVNLDADVIVPPDWLSRISGHFRDQRVVAVTGPYTSHPDGKTLDWFNGLLTVFLALTYRLLGFPLGFYGGNLAMRRQKFIDSGGYDLRYPYDRMAILQQLRKRGGRVVFDSGLRVWSSDRRTKGRLLQFLWKEVFLQYFVNSFSIRFRKKNLGSWDDIR